MSSRPAGSSTSPCGRCAGAGRAEYPARARLSGDAFWRFTPDSRRAALAPRVEEVLRSGLTSARTSSLKGAYLATLRDVALGKSLRSTG